MRTLNPEHIARLIPLINQGPFFQLLNMQVTELGWGTSEVVMSLERKHLNPFGGVHGGAYTSVLDTAAYWSAYCQMPEDAGFITVDVNVSNLSALRGGRLTVKGKCIKTGRTMGLAEATAIDSDGRIIAHGTSKMLAIPGKQTINDVLNSLGGEPLPPKYLD